MGNQKEQTESTTSAKHKDTASDGRAMKYKIVAAVQYKTTASQ
jgi:hypothetical protein